LWRTRFSAAIRMLTLPRRLLGSLNSDLFSTMHESACDAVDGSSTGTQVP